MHHLGLTKLINYSLSLFPLVLEYRQTKYYFITLGPATAGSGQTVDAVGPTVDADGRRVSALYGRNAVENVLK